MTLGAMFLLLSLEIVLGQSTMSPNLETSLKNRVDLQEIDTFLIATQPDWSPDERIIHVKQISDQGHYTIVTSWAEARQLSHSASIKYIDLHRRPSEESALDDPNFAYNNIRKAQNEYPNILGAGFAVSVKERRFDNEDIDLSGKYLDLGSANEDQSQHATDMATIIAGMGNTTSFNKGVAPGLAISSSDFNNLLPDNSISLLQNQIYTQNHSYGLGIENYYGIEAAAYDQEVYNHPKIMHVFSAGNAGRVLPSDGTYSDLPFANLTGTFKQAKNILTVSAVDTSLVVSDLNSRGPAYDGRLKPELTAYGGRGTSDAAAIVSGISTLVQNSFSNTYDSIPDASTVKAILIATADDIGVKRPDYYTGYGSVNASKALACVKKGQIMTRRLFPNQTASLDLNVPQEVQSVQIAISWTDPPATEGTSKALINDIDTKLINDTQEWLPWTLSTTPSTTELNKLAVRGEDHLNNVEYITLDQPSAGAYQLQLSTPDLATYSQVVSIAWCFTYLNEFEFDFPSGSDPLRADSYQSIYWSHSLSQSVGKLEYHFENKWNLITNNFRLNDPRYVWHTPEASGTYQLRATIGGQEFRSDEFLISEVPEVTVAFNCESNFGLQWTAIADAEEYHVYEMQTDSLRLIGSTSDTSFVINKNQSTFYSVAPVYSKEEGLRNLAFNYSFQGAFCYVNFFSAQKLEIDAVINLELSSVLNVESVTFLKEYNDTLEILREIPVTSSTSFTLRDPDLDPGTIDYFAVLNLKDGTSIQSNYSSILVDKPGKVTFFPNPTADIYIYTVSNGDKMQLKVSDRSGRLVLEEELLDRVNSIYIEELDAGVYLYQVFKDGEVIDSGRFVKL